MKRPEVPHVNGDPSGWGAGGLARAALRGGSPAGAVGDLGRRSAAGAVSKVRAFVIPGSATDRAGRQVMAERVGPGLSGPRPERSGDPGPVLAEREALGQAELDATGGGDNLHADLQQAVLEGPDLGSGTGSVRSVPAQFLHQDVGRRGQEDAELVGEEARATGAIDLKAILEFLDSVLRVTAGAVDPLVQPAGCLPEVGYDEAGVVLRLASFQPHDLGLDDDPPMARPLPGPVAAVAVDMLGAPAAPGHFPGLSHQPAGGPRQHAVLREADHVVHSRLVVKEVEDLRTAEAAVEADEDPRPRKGAAHLRDHPTQDAQHSQAVRGIAGPQKGGEEILLGLVIKAQEPEEGQLAPGVIVPVKEAQLLGAVRRVDGGVEVDGHLPALAAEAEPMSVDDGRDQSLAHAVQIAGTDRVLEAREGRLGRQGITRDRIAIDQQPMDRVLGQARRVIAVSVAARETKDALGKKIPDPVLDLPRHPAVPEALGQLIDQAESGVHCLEEHGPAVGAAVGQVELRDQGAGQKALERKHTAS